MSRPSVCLVAMHDTRLSAAASRRLRAVRDGVEGAGSEVFELSPPPPHPISRDDRARRHCPTWIARLLSNSASVPKRLVGELLYGGWVFAMLVRLRPRRTVVTLPYVPVAGFVWLFSVLVGRRRCRVAVDVRDLTWEYGTATQPGVRSAVVSWWMRGSVRLVSRRADIVSCTNERQRDYLRRLCGRDVIVCRNGVSDRELEQLRALPSAGRQTSKPRLLYAGTIGYAQDVRQLLALARSWPECELTIVGSGALATDIQLVAGRLQNVSLMSKVPEEELFVLYGRSHVLVACLREGPEFATAVPSKLYEYAATGRVLVFIGSGAGADVTIELGGIAASEVGPALVRDITTHLQNNGSSLENAAAEIPSREAEVVPVVCWAAEVDHR